MPLRVVALRGSVPGAWPADFKGVAGKHAKLAFEQRAQLADIYSELTAGRHASRGIAVTHVHRRHVQESRHLKTLCTFTLVHTKSAADRERSQQARKDGCCRRKKKSAAQADAVTLGDAWLAPAIQQGALQPIPTLERWRWWVRPASRCTDQTHLFQQDINCFGSSIDSYTMSDPHPPLSDINWAALGCQRATSSLVRKVTAGCILQEMLPPRWRQLVRRDGSGRLDPQGAVWGAPYRWGCTLIAYDEQKLDR